MTSNDILISLINSRFDAQNARFDALERQFDAQDAKIEKKFAEQDAKITIIAQDTAQLKYDVSIIKHDISHIQNTVYWGFAIIAFVVSFVGIFKREPREKKSHDYISRKEIQRMIDTALKERDK